MIQFSYVCYYNKLNSAHHGKIFINAIVLKCSYLDNKFYDSIYNLIVWGLCLHLP